MKTVQQISKDTGVGLYSIRKLVRTGFIKAIEENPVAYQIRCSMARNNPISVPQLLALIDDPSMEYDLGRYAEFARSQVQALGDFRAEAAPREVVACITGAADGDKECIAVIGRWLRSAIPAEQVSYAWVAIRLVWSSHVNLRANNVAHVKRALLGARTEIPGWYEVKTVGGRKMTYFWKPDQTFDL